MSRKPQRVLSTDQVNDGLRKLSQCAKPRLGTNVGRSVQLRLRRLEEAGFIYWKDDATGWDLTVRGVERIAR